MFADNSISNPAQLLFEWDWLYKLFNELRTLSRQTTSINPAHVIPCAWHDYDTWFTDDFIYTNSLPIHASGRVCHEHYFNQININGTIFVTFYTDYQSVCIRKSMPLLFYNINTICFTKHNLLKNEFHNRCFFNNVYFHLKLQLKIPSVSECLSHCYVAVNSHTHIHTYIYIHINTTGLLITQRKLICLLK